MRDFKPRYRNESKKLSYARLGSSCQRFLRLELAQVDIRGVVVGSERKLVPMTESPSVIEIKLDRLIDDMRLLRSQMIAFDRRLKELSEPSEQQPESKSRHALVGPTPAAYGFRQQNSWRSRQT